MIMFDNIVLLSFLQRNTPLGCKLCNHSEVPRSRRTFDLWACALYWISGQS